MGDADETYPIAELAPFVDRLAAGDDLVMGSRFEGTIHGEAMPWLNRHIGNPILTGMLNLFFGVKISDAHCGMRAVRRDALPVLDLHSTGMEFASEMVFKAFRRDLKVSEIPIDYYPRVGESKLNRFGDAWRHVKFMLLYSPSWLYFVPGLILLVLGVLGAIALAAGPVTILGRPWQIHTLFACIAAILLGTQIVQLGIFARAFAASHLGETDRLIEWARGRISLEHGLALGGIVLLGGLVTLTAIFVGWALDGFGALSHEYATAIGFTLVAVGVQVILGSFFVSLLTMRTTERSPGTATTGWARRGHHAVARRLTRRAGLPRLRPPVPGHGRRWRAVDARSRRGLDGRRSRRDLSDDAALGRGAARHSRGRDRRAGPCGDGLYRRAAIARPSRALRACRRPLPRASRSALRCRPYGRVPVLPDAGRGRRSTAREISARRGLVRGLVAALLAALRRALVGTAGWLVQRSCVTIASSRVLHLAADRAPPSGRGVRRHAHRVAGSLRWPDRSVPRT